MATDPELTQMLELAEKDSKTAFITLFLLQHRWPLLWLLRAPRQVPERAMAPHSSTLAWKIPWMEEPGRLQSMGSLRVGHD